MDITEELTEEYLNGSSAFELATKYDLQPHQVYYRLEKAGVERRSNKLNSRKYIVNHSFFKNIDCEVKAYWLGFLYADGAVLLNADGSRQVKIDLTRTDFTHLQNFVLDLESTYPVRFLEQDTSYKKNTKYARLCISSEEMVQDLINLGCGANKTFKLSKPPIQEQFYRHFIRGYVDGDGSISIHKTTLDGYRLKICGTHELLSWIQDILPRKGGIYPMKSIYSLETHADNIVWLYEDSTRSLERKFKRYEDIIESRRTRHDVAQKNGGPE